MRKFFYFCLFTFAFFCSSPAHAQSWEPGASAFQGVGDAGTAKGKVVTIQGIAGGTAVPISGTVTTSGALTDTQLRAAAVPVSGPVASAATDPCQSNGVAKSSVALNVTASAEIIAASGATAIYACGWSATIGGTTPTYKFHYGTGSVCATGTTDLTGVFAPTVGSFSAYNPGMTAFKTTASQALCVTTGGTSPSVQGVLTYIQK